MVRKSKQKKMVRSVAIKPIKKKIKSEEKELTRLGMALRSLGGLGGGYAGNMIGMGQMGAAAGTHLGASLSRWLGSGDYTVKSNSLLAEDGIPVMHNTNQTVRIRHREFIGDVVGSVAYSVRYNLPINPGLASSFPWLSGISENFQEYSIKGMVYHYVPTSGDAVASTNNALGSVIMNTNYRVTQPPPTSKVEALNEYFSTDSRPCEPFCHAIECDPKENPYNIQYVRTGTVPVGEDAKTYDLGTLYVSTAGMQVDGIVLGELWCTYDIELKKPLASNIVGSSIATFANFGAGTYTTANLFAIALTASPVINTLPVTSVLDADSKSVDLTIPAGYTGTYFVQVAGKTPAGGSSYTGWSVLSGGTKIDATLAQVTNSNGVNSPFYAGMVFSITSAAAPTVLKLSVTSFIEVDAFEFNVTLLSR